MDTNALLAARGKTHGKYSEHARITQSIKTLMELEINWEHLNPSMREALDMIAHKIGRILAGNPHFADHWEDIAGYAKLVANEINGNPQ